MTHHHAGTGAPRPDTWTHRVRFLWSPELPAELREPLTEHGHLEDLGSGEYAWTLTLSGDVGPGSDTERADRAEWITNDALAAIISEAGLAWQAERQFTHQSTDLLRA